MQFRLSSKKNPVVTEIAHIFFFLTVPTFDLIYRHSEVTEKYDCSKLGSFARSWLLKHTMFLHLNVRRTREILPPVLAHQGQNKQWLLISVYVGRYQCPNPIGRLLWRLLKSRKQNDLVTLTELSYKDTEERQQLVTTTIRVLIF